MKSNQLAGGLLIGGSSMIESFLFWCMAHWITVKAITLTIIFTGFGTLLLEHGPQWIMQQFDLVPAKGAAKHDSH
jgi:hypothetical protein